MPDSDRPAVELLEVGKSYAGRVALDRMCMSVRRGAVFGLLGPNGAGKTTTLRLVLGFLKADSGEVQVLGLPAWEKSVELKQRLGYLSADTQLYPWLTAKEGLKFSAQVRQLKLQERGLELCEFLGLDPELRVRQMSRGNRQKLGLVLALCHNPELIILDEPTSGFDPLVQNAFAELMELERERGATVLLSSHSFQEVDRLCDSVAIVRAGKVLVQDSLSTLRGLASRRVRVTFEGSIPKELPGRLEEPEFSANEIAGRWRGDAGPLVEWCKDRSVRDLEVSPPLLDDAFMDYYR